MAARPDTPWYRVPLLWLGIAILLISLAASVHLIIISRSAAPEPSREQGPAFRGVPLTQHADHPRESQHDR